MEFIKIIKVRMPAGWFKLSNAFTAATKIKEEYK